jgi:hypothetical protein
LNVESLVAPRGNAVISFRFLSHFIFSLPVSFACYFLSPSDPFPTCFPLVCGQPCLDVIDKKPTGVLPMVDEELKVPKATDQTLLDRMHKQVCDCV